MASNQNDDAILHQADAAIPNVVVVSASPTPAKVVAEAEAMKCVGCGGEIEYEVLGKKNGLGGVFAYGNTHPPRKPDYAQHVGRDIQDMVQADYHKTLCPKCTRVIKSIILNSNLSEHWGNEDFK